jgi:hypothetical protein
MTQHEEAVRLADAAMRRVRDLKNAMTAITTTSRLVGEQLHDIEAGLLAVANYIRTKPENLA